VLPLVELASEADASFDAVVSIAPALDASIAAQLLRVLKPGGRISIQVRILLLPSFCCSLCLPPPLSSGPYIDDVAVDRCLLPLSLLRARFCSPVSVSCSPPLRVRTCTSRRSARSGLPARRRGSSKNRKPPLPPLPPLLTPKRRRPLRSGRWQRVTWRMTASVGGALRCS
jgi:hypothetical protein